MYQHKPYIRYQPGNAALDYIVINWHSKLVHRPEFAWTFCKGMESPAEFLHFFMAQKVLILELDNNHNVEQAIWFEPSMSGAYVGFWSDDHIRGKRRTSLFLRVVTLAFDNVPVLLSTIKDRENVDSFLTMHGKLGFVVMGKIPYVFDGCASWALWMDKERFLKANASRLARLGIVPAWGEEEN